MRPIDARVDLSDAGNCRGFCIDEPSVSLSASKGFFMMQTQTAEEIAVPVPVVCYEDGARVLGGMSWRV